MCTTCILDHKRALDPLELKLQMDVSYHMDADS